ncbi:hypothetical protein NIES2107_33590 [Nostoc carneum NIES-2107]|nr:hypothetical protein NIES2107_33590 [Nostoc carneum NIES-2107]
MLLDDLASLLIGYSRKVTEEGYSVSQATEVHTNLLYQNNQLQKRTSLD